MDPWALFHQAVACQQQGDLARAEQLYIQLLSAHPGHPVVNYQLGDLRIRQGRHAEALENFDAALAARPEEAQIWLQRGNALQGLARHEEALASYEGALALRPDNPEALNNRGQLLHGLGRYEEALASFEAALAVQPGQANTLYNRGNALLDLARPDEALVSFEAALAVAPGHSQALNNRGNALQNLRRFDEALASYDLALAAAPDYPDALLNRGVALRRLGRFAEAMASYDRLLAISPHHPKAFGEAALTALNLCDWPRQAQIRAQLAARAAEVQPWTMLNYNEDGALQLACARAAVREMVPIAPALLWTGEAYGHHRLRIAYISFDFRAHPVAAQLAPVLEQHDRTHFEIIGVSAGPDDGSDLRARLAAACEQFYDVRGLTQRAIAERLRQLEVDMVVELNGHTDGSALAALAHRPAPVQVSWLGYPGTMGADFIDYVIADGIALPQSDQSFYSEKIVHLPDSFFPADPALEIGPTPSRADAGLPPEAFVFCCFNNNAKISEAMFASWMRLLAAVPGSLLWLRHNDDAVTARLKQEAVRRDIAVERLIFAPAVPMAAHLARHRLADLFLDTLPYNAHATAAHALWAGLPVLTLKGKTFAGRVAAGLLQAVGLPELVTKTLEDYEATALALARDPARLAMLKDRLAQNRATAPLFDITRFTRNLETAYAAMLKEKTA